MTSENIPATPVRIYITRQAEATIRAETRRHRDGATLGSETGGVLIGRRISPPGQPIELLIVAATGPGERAQREATEFSPDIEHVNLVLDNWRAFYPAIDYIGTWHKHPSGVETFSLGDAQMARATFTDPSYKIEELINPIAWDDDAGFRIRYYYMSRAMARAGGSFAELGNERVTVIDEGHRLVLAERELPLWTASEQERLTDRGYTLSVKLRPELRSLFYTLTTPRLPETSVFLVVPPEFPQGRPQVFVEQQGREVQVDGEALVDVLLRISAGGYRLADLADAVVAELQSPGSVLGQLNIRPKRSTIDPRADNGAVELITSWRRRSLTWAGITAALAVAALLVGMFLSRSQGSTGDDQYAATWQTVDAALTRGDASTVSTAISSLEQIRRADPAGVVYARNSTVTSTLVSANLSLGELLIDREPPDLEGASRAFRAVKGLDAGNQDAQSGLDRVEEIRNQSAINAQASTAEVVSIRRWQVVDSTTDLREQVSLIEALLIEGVAADPAGVSTVQRLHAARLAYVAQLTDEGNYDEARVEAQRAIAAADRAGRSQEAADALANVSLAEARRALAQDDPLAALSVLSRLDTISPRPSDSVLTEAASLRALVDSAIDEQSAIPRAWEDYDRSIASGDFAAAVTALDVINGFTGPLPDPAIYGPPAYDPRTQQVGLLHLQARADYAEALKRQGFLDEAEQQYAAGLLGFAEGGALALNERREQYAQELEALRVTLDQGNRSLAAGRQRWGTYAWAAAARDWPAALVALTALRDARDFGAGATIPGGRATVAALIADVETRLAAARATSTEPPTAAVVSPTAAAEPPTVAAESPTVAVVSPTVAAEPPTSTPSPLVLTFRVVLQEISEGDMRQLYNLRRPDSFCGSLCNGFFEPTDSNVSVELRTVAPGDSRVYNVGYPFMKIGPGLFELEVRVAQPGVVARTLDGRGRAEQGKYYLVSLKQEP